MSLLIPAWLLLIIPLAALTYAFRPLTRLLTCLRCVMVVLIVLAMCHPLIRFPGRTGTVVVVADRSASMRSEDLRNQEEVINLLASTMGPREQLAVVAFGRDAAVEHPPQSGAFSGFVADIGKDQSNLGIALEKALSLVPYDGVGRLLVLSDGHWTGIAPYGVAGRASTRNIGIDFRLQEKPLINDLAIDRVAVPERLTPAESFMITAWIHSPVRQEVTYELMRGKSRLAAGKRNMVTGMNRLVFRDRAIAAGTQQYTLRVQGDLKDSQPENNQATVLVGIQGPKPLLCVSRTEQQTFSNLLRKGKLDVVTQRPGDVRWSLASLSNYSGIILENIPASDIGSSGMELIAAWIEGSGSGLMMTGGRNSFAPGGYFRSPLERILPVSMELKKEHRKFSLAMVIVMDRSGSMAASAGGGKTKMDLANIGAVQVLDLLTDNDEIGVLAVDSTPHEVIPLAPVAVNRGEREQILRVQSMGGGIFVYAGLKEATRMLLKAKAQTRHIILFADAADSEKPGEYVELLARCEKANITCSVIGLGTEDDCDAALLRDIARMGDGQSFFTSDAMEIPRLFAQDTFAVSRSALVAEPTAVTFTAGYAMLGATPPKSTPTVGGYNLCYVRPEANMAVMTTDEYKAPLVATWQAGRGRALCYTGEADGEHTGAIASWPEAGEFFSSLARWVAGDSGSLPADMMLVQELTGGACRIELHLDPRRKKTPFHGQPYVDVLHGIPGAAPSSTRFAMKWVSADRLSMELPLYGQETALPTVHIGECAPAQLAPVCLPYSPEFRPPVAGRGFDSLRRLAEITGGKESGDVSTIWHKLPTQTRHMDVSHWLYILAIVVLLLEVLQRRTGLLSTTTLPTFKRPHIKGGTRNSEPKPPKRKRSPNAKQRSPKTKTQAAQPPAPPADDSTMDALEEARKRARRRTQR